MERERELAVRVGQILVEWYERQHRDLPWRKTRDPYRIWVSETMLQQTRVETVIPYYERFLEEFPSVRDLAQAAEEEVLKQWEGLGYYSRAQNLLRGAQVVMERFGGRVPDDPEVIREIPGVGPYTAGAILSIAYGRDVPAVDGNGLRVFARIFLVDEPVDKPAGRRKISSLMQAAIPPGHGGALNQAVMDLGSGVCLPRAPRCRDCPVLRWCRAAEEGVWAEYPVKTKKKPPRPTRVAAGLASWQGYLFVRRRPDRGLLAGLWEFPSVEVRSGESWEEAASRAMAEAGLAVEAAEPLARAEHVFSHLKWDFRVYRCTARPEQMSQHVSKVLSVAERTSGGVGKDQVPWPGDSAAAWVSAQALGHLPFPAVYRKIWPLLKEKGVW
ncbi:MAG TPA: A/G-specific adenine glycosylase [Alicyclobacillus sp.]|nr:A/G-specific adenine glycosylase [Alicyclobacillus sp.]